MNGNGGDPHSLGRCGEAGPCMAMCQRINDHTVIFTGGHLYASGFRLLSCPWCLTPELPTALLASWPWPELLQSLKDNGGAEA